MRARATALALENLILSLLEALSVVVSAKAVLDPGTAGTILAADSARLPLAWLGARHAGAPGRPSVRRLLPMRLVETREPLGPIESLPP